MKLPENFSLSYAAVPRDRHWNTLWRCLIWERCAQDQNFAGYIENVCRDNFLFYCNTFVWTKSENLDDSCRPFILYPYQERAAERIIARILAGRNRKSGNKRRQDVVIQKSRDLGATWLVLAIADWFWRFRAGVTIMVYSRVEEDVDAVDANNTLFDKLDFIEKHLPAFLQTRGGADRPRLRIPNPKNGSVIQGYASNPDAGSGGRALFVIADEFSKVQDGNAMIAAQQYLSPCVIRPSTHRGAATAFAALVNYGLKNPDCGIDVITMHWSEHPEKAEGLYSIKGGKITILDQKWHDENPGYKFRLTKTNADPGVPWEFLRSPYFDGEDDGTPNKQNLAQEVQISQLASGSPFFDANRLESIKTSNERAPDWQGNLTEILPEFERFHDSDGRANRCKAWWKFVRFAVPQTSTYSMGIDIASGNGSSDSVLSVSDDVTGEEVFQFCSNRVTPEDFARLCYAMARHFITPHAVPHMGWDQSGPGVTFGEIILRLIDEDIERGAKLPCTIFFYVPEDRIGAEQSRTPGVPAGGGRKVPMLQAYWDAMTRNEFITHDSDVYTQCQQFYWDGATVEHKAAKNGSGDKGKQHGDAVMAQVVLVQVMRSRPEPSYFSFEPPELTGQDARYAEILRRQEEEKRNHCWWKKTS